MTPVFLEEERETSFLLTKLIKKSGSSLHILILIIQSSFGVKSFGLTNQDSKVATKVC